MRKKRSALTTKKRKKSGGLVFFVFITIVSFSVAAFFTGLDKRMLPTALQAVDMMAKSKINTVINDSVTAVIAEQNLISSQFYETNVSTEGRVNSLSVNTVLINSICNRLAADISNSLNNLNTERIIIPYGALSGVRAFANIGPGYPIDLMSLGEAVVDYSSSFESVGINQVNFQIWLNVDSTVRVINPLADREVVVTRKIPLVNTVINSEVPQMYFNGAGSLDKIWQ
jgi:sporulation protein YunB